MVVHLSKEEARRLLAQYHFKQTDLAGVFDRLGTVQYDPLNPVGRNVDLVFQARIPGYKVDDWQKAAYIDRTIYDTWDKHTTQLSSLDGPKAPRPLQHARCPLADSERSFRWPDAARPTGLPWATHPAPTTNG